MAATQRARRLARQQMEFVAAVSHELRTPVAAILSAGQNLAAGVVAEPAQVKRYGALIEREGRRLSAMVGQVLDFAGLEAGRQPYALQATEVGPVVDAALDDCRGLLAERQARVERDVAPGLPPVHGDPAALRQAVRNLIENAAKYGGPDPWIGVRARPAGHEVEITVADRGMGVERGEVRRLFEPFFRGREAVGRSIAGSGLGLSVVRHIARAHRGRVSCAAGDAGRGSAFTLHLPAAEPIA
jgi:signal transduction histidine kinase